MHVYIDESGIFSNPANKTNIASVVAALSVPTTRKKDLFKKFKELSVKWRDEHGEVKGKDLDEEQIAKVWGVSIYVKDGDAWKFAFGMNSPAM